jgi:pimeloyl-ACP methyl ester carboxylesterase
MNRDNGIYIEKFGAGARLLVLLHGQGANGDVWHGLRPLIARGWQGACLIPDLRGHGRSPHRPPYGYGTYAADIAEAIASTEEIVLVGHSLGGAVALTLASGWFGLRVSRVVAFGIKVKWSVEERARRLELARQPPRRFAARGEAVERYLKVSGQFGLVDPASPAASSGVVETESGFRLAADPAIAGGELPDIRTVYRAAQAPVTIAVGAKDPMVPVADARELDAGAVILEGVGHNAHIERPDLIWDLIGRG